MPNVPQNSADSKTIFKSYCKAHFLRDTADYVHSVVHVMQKKNLVNLFFVRFCLHRQFLPQLYGGP